jgi:cation:H+ antiporter
MMPLQNLPGYLAGLIRGHALLVGVVLVFAAANLAVRADALPFMAVLVAQIVLFVTVIYLVAIGADWLVNSAARIADTFGVSQLMIGLTVVAFGTSAPEGAVSLVAGFQGNGDITIANVVGSNIFNICFILGGMALISPLGLPVRPELIRRDTSMLILATLLLFLFVGGNPFTGAAAEGVIGFSAVRLLNLRLEFGEGLILASVLAGYLVHLYRVRQADARSAQHVLQAGEGQEQNGAGAPGGGLAITRDILVLCAGLVVIIAGSDILVGHAEVVQGEIKGLGAVWFAKHLGLSDYLIGVTIIAAGTSSPELIVSFVAAFKGRFDMTIGNLIGSDLFNMLGVVGLAGIVLQEPLAPAVSVAPAVIGSLLGLSALVAITWGFMWTGRRLSRWEGVALILIGIGRWIMDFLAQPPAG